MRSCHVIVWLVMMLSALGEVEAAEDYGLPVAEEANAFLLRTFLTPYGSYISDSTNDDVVYGWPLAAVAKADMAMVQAAGSAAVDSSGVLYSDRVAQVLTFYYGAMWAHEGVPWGGFFSMSNANGSYTATNVQYADDNAYAGTTYLQALGQATALHQGKHASIYGHISRQIARFLLATPLWDDVLGGGYWWNTNQPFKPTNANALAVVFFATIASHPGLSPQEQAAVTARAVNTTSWMEGHLFSPADGLFLQYVAPSGESQTIFAYDNGIMVEGYLSLARLFSQLGDEEEAQTYMAKATTLADAVVDRFYINGMFAESNVSGAINGVLSRWPSESMLSVSRSTGDGSWAALGMENTININRCLVNDSSGASYYDSFPDCSNLRFYTSKSLLDSAFTQLLNALLT